MYTSHLVIPAACCEDREIGHHAYRILCLQQVPLKHTTTTTYNKKAELSQRWPHVAPCIWDSLWVPWKFSVVPDYTHGYFSWNFNGFFFRLMVWICVQNLKFVPVPEIIGGIQKIWQSLDTPILPFLQTFNGLLFGWTLWMFWPNLKSVALPVGCSWDNLGYPKNLDSPWICPCTLFS